MTVLGNHFQEHLSELRRRVAISFAAMLAFSGIAYFFSMELAEFFIQPLFVACPELDSLVYTNLTEAFISYLKISVIVGVGASFPVILYQVWRFISPGLHSHEKKMGMLVVFWATFLFGFGIAFAYIVVMPQALTYLMSFASENLDAKVKLDSYLSFVARSGMAFGLSFEIPFLMVMAAKTGVVGRLYFAKQRKYYYIAIAVVSFLLAAGDLMSTLLLIIPLCVLYELGLVVIRVFTKKSA